MTTASLKSNPRPPHPLRELFRKVGTASEFAKAIGVTPQAISQWVKVPIWKAAEVERVTGVPRSELRPDIWGNDTHSDHADHDLAQQVAE
jgi:DNA-binding transcriptional regulator YdaS (Cro superfamily)